MAEAQVEKVTTPTLAEVLSFLIEILSVLKNIY